ncbi:hypothetical protein Salat_2134000 [Sesamum alatum]|uniref:Uncharacterized protein n=1 Tax=Sesamum alatum TaxID=300844 RepID=A0AAE2CH43_9LAMI|nr:hypothetical protein Salat_2134000 [Sesamum alatum]
MQDRRNKNMCYNCDETFRPVHKCKQQFMYCLLTEEEATMGMEEGEKPQTDESEVDMTISLNALSGNTDFNTFRVKGKAYGQELQVLIDGGSTYCFLDEETTER